MTEKICTGGHVMNGSDESCPRCGAAAVSNEPVDADSLTSAPSSESPSITGAGLSAA